MCNYPHNCERDSLIADLRQKNADLMETIKKMQFEMSALKKELSEKHGASN